MGEVCGPAARRVNRSRSQVIGMYVARAVGSNCLFPCLVVAASGVQCMFWLLGIVSPLACCLGSFPCWQVLVVFFVVFCAIGLHSFCTEMFGVCCAREFDKCSTILQRAFGGRWRHTMPIRRLGTYEGCEHPSTMLCPRALKGRMVQCGASCSMSPTLLC